MTNKTGTKVNRKALPYGLSSICFNSSSIPCIILLCADEQRKAFTFLYPKHLVIILCDSLYLIKNFDFITQK